MLVQCENNRGTGVPPSMQFPAGGLHDAAEFDLTIGKRYAVYCITVHRGQHWYYVFDDAGLSWPTWRPASLFSVVDSGLPKSWVYGYDVSSSGAERNQVRISFPEWALDACYYERLVDEDPGAIEVLDRYREEIENGLAATSAIKE